ncbi:hypothetical protein QR680_004916 [Steinernema hermaphroditum]|uniref:Uncharacterized protein n=1 Tax=Steinernema hermaphroditum TaxID=289476 RepID=A0AA39HRN9_9BILA|nr:hypothetical protein QR680_004916 [Steinernema hermaphroditum]
MDRILPVVVLLHSIAAFESLGTGLIHECCTKCAKIGVEESCHDNLGSCLNSVVHDVWMCAKWVLDGRCPEYSIFYSVKEDSLWAVKNFLEGLAAATAVTLFVHLF